MAHVLLNWTNTALFEAEVVTSQIIVRKDGTGAWSQLPDAVITAGESDGTYKCQDFTIPTPTTNDIEVQYQIISQAGERELVGNIISVTVPKPPPAVDDLTGIYVD